LLLDSTKTGGYKQLTPELKAAIVKAVEENHSLPYSVIAKRFDIAKSTVSYIMKLYTSTGSVDRRPTSGRPRKITEKHNELLFRLSKENPDANAVEINAALRATFEVTASNRTVRRRLALSKKPNRTNAILLKTQQYNNT
jgi:transposase